MNEIEYRRERHRQQRLERLGPNPQCLFCPESDPGCLEQHHLGGRKFGDDCVIVCRNDHRKLTDKQKEHPSIAPERPTTPFECLGRLLLGIADALELLKVPQQLVLLIRDAALHLIEIGPDFPATRGEQP
ncbi:MAG: hypothetical protein WB646_19070 [Steroidobacteraceae bacterium]